MNAAEALLLFAGILLTLGIIGWVLEAAHDWRTAARLAQADHDHESRGRHPSHTTVVVNGRVLPRCEACGSAVYDHLAHARYCAALDEVNP